MTDVTERDRLQRVLTDTSVAAHAASKAVDAAIEAHERALAYRDEARRNLDRYDREHTTEASA